MFGDSEVKKAISDALSTDITIPNNKRAALVTFINQDKAQIAFAFKTDEHWHVELLAEHDWTGDNQVGAIIKGVW